VGAVNYKEEQEKLVTKSLPELTDMFRLHALKHGWGEKTAKEISVVFEEGGYGYDYPVSLDEQVFNLENGDVGKPPQPAQRTFKTAIIDKIHDIVEDAVIASLMKSDVFE